MKRLTYRTSLAANALLRVCAAAGLAATLIAQTPPPASTTTTTPPPAAAPAPPEEPKPFNNWTWKGIKLSGILDVYYANNLDDPQGKKNFIRNFDTESDNFDLNMLKFAVEKSAEPVGFRIDVGMGRAFDIFAVSEPTRRVTQLDQFLQGYVSFKPKSWKGLQVDVGKFYTSAGAELTETHLGWNYSRAYLYANGPYYHFGIRTTMSVTKSWTAGVQLINGWNNVADQNSAKTLGLTSLYTKGKVTWAANYYIGVEKPKPLKGVRNFIDNVVTVNTTKWHSFYVNYDYGIEGQGPGQKGSKFQGIAFANRFAMGKYFALAPRVELYKDHAGFITGQAQTLKEFTMTGEIKFVDGFLTRIEYRRDWSDKEFFDRRAGLSLGKNQTTFVVGLVAYFGPK